MKKLVLLSLISLALATSASALKIPSDVYSLSELEEACAEAEKEGKGVSFVYTDPTTK